MKITSYLIGAFVLLGSVAQAQKSLTPFLQPQKVRGGEFYVPTSGSNNPTYLESDWKFTLGMLMAI